MPVEKHNPDPNFHEDDMFMADDYLINVIKRAVRNSQNIHVSLVGSGSITILASIGVYFNNTDDIESFCITPASKYKVTVLNKKDVNTDAANTGRNIDELMWIAGFYASSGRLMDGCYRNDVVELMYWPNLTRLPSTPNTMRVRLYSNLTHHLHLNLNRVSLAKLLKS